MFRQTLQKRQKRRSKVHGGYTERHCMMPQNRRMTGVPGGEATQFKPGQSGNPGGRPKRKRITEALEKVLTPEQCLAVAQALLKQAKKGSISHVQEAANRLEGRVE